MINNTEHLIEQYVLENLSSQEAKSFEQYLSKNPDVKKQVEIQKDVLEAIKQKGRLQMKANLAQINPKVSSPLTQKIAIAAATIATATIVGIGIYTTSQKQQLVELPRTTSHTISAYQLEKETAEEKIIISETDLVTANEVTTTETVTNIETKENITLPTSTTFTENNEVITVTEVVSNLKKPSTTTFDPTIMDLNDSDEKSIGTDEGIVTDPSTSSNSESEIPVITLANSKIQGFSYDGNSIGISGTYKSAYTVTQKEGMLVFEYDNKFYNIIECKKIEKWSDHEITDPKILKRL